MDFKFAGGKRIALNRDHVMAMEECDGGKIRVYTSREMPFVIVANFDEASFWLENGCSQKEHLARQKALLDQLECQHERVSVAKF